MVQNVQSVSNFRSSSASLVLSIRLTLKPTADSIRFQLIERPKGKDNSRFPGPAEGAGTVMNADSEAGHFPLAKLGRELQPGMEIRLAFEGTSGVNPKNCYSWIRPMIVGFLEGWGYNTKDEDRNKAALNVSSFRIYSTTTPLLSLAR